MNSAVKDEDAIHYPLEFLQTLHQPGVPPIFSTSRLVLHLYYCVTFNLQSCALEPVQVKALFRNVI